MIDYDKINQKQSNNPRTTKMGEASLSEDLYAFEFDMFTNALGQLRVLIDTYNYIIVLQDIRSTTAQSIKCFHLL